MLPFSPKNNQPNLFTDYLSDVLDSRDPLVALADTIPWDYLDEVAIEGLIDVEKFWFLLFTDFCAVLWIKFWRCIIIMKDNFNYNGDSKMRNIIIATLLVSGSLMAAESVQANNTGGFAESIDGAALYKQHCALCHGERGEESPAKTAPLAGRDATILALTIRAYRDQSNEIGAYTMHKSNQMMKDETVNLSDRHISALAKYISGLQ